MANLASRLAVKSSENEDDIMKTIMSDSELAPECRTKILSYLSEE